MGKEKKGAAKVEETEEAAETDADKGEGEADS